MNNIQANPLIQNIYPQNIATTDASTAANISGNAAIAEANDAPRMIKQDSSDVLRQGSSGRIRAEKKLQKDSARQLARSMSNKKRSQAMEIANVFLERIALRHQQQQPQADYETLARDMTRDLIEEYKGNGYSQAEQIALLTELQERDVVKNDVTLQSIIQKNIDELYFSSTAAQMALHSVDLDANTKGLFATPDEARAATDALLLTYSNQATFLTQAKEFFGEEKFKKDFPEICSHFMTKLTSFISAMTNSSGMEKAGLQAALEGISSLQQVQGVYYAADALTTRMEKQHAA